METGHPNTPLSFWEKWSFIMVSKEMIMSLNIVFTLPPILKVKNPTFRTSLIKEEFGLTRDEEYIG